VDKLIYAALQATLMEYVRQNHDAIPFVRMLRTTADGIRKRAERMVEKLPQASHLKAEIVQGESLVGGGSAPTSTLPTFLIAITAQSLSADQLAERLRLSTPAIVARVEEGRVLLDLRTAFEDEDELIVKALKEVAP
jgi:L-seryl-tRNA(Ser) seleniumtransferase